MDRPQLTQPAQGAISPSRWSVFCYNAKYVGRGPEFVGLIVLIPMLLGLAAWASFAPLNSAAIASGEIVLSADRKAVQHLEGGLVTEVFVNEGQEVTLGQPLIVVQDLAERTRKRSLTLQIVNNRALIARLTAERDDLEVPDFSALSRGLDAPNHVRQEFKDLHLGVFTNLQFSMQSTADLAASRQLQISQEMAGVQAQLDAKLQDRDLVAGELEAKRTLLANGIATETEVTAMERNLIAIDGEIGSLTASIARLEQSSLDQDVEVLKMRNDRRAALLEELEQAHLTAEDMRQELLNLQDRQDRAVIRAPASGVILDMQVQTVGAVISPGTLLMDIVPSEDDLIIEAKVNPVDIDLVTPGGIAEVQLSAFNTRRVDKLDATIETISGDILTDEISGERYFLARLRVEEDVLQTLPADVQLSPGMPADVFLIAGERTVADYLLSPLIDAARRGFREE